MPASEDDSKNWVPIIILGFARDLNNQINIDPGGRVKAYIEGHRITQGYLLEPDEGKSGGPETYFWEDPENLRRLHSSVPVTLSKPDPYPYKFLEITG